MASKSRNRKKERVRGEKKERVQHVVDGIGEQKEKTKEESQI